MPMKDLFHRMQPMQLYVVLILSIAYFLVQLFLSHITHALTLLVDSYHMLCNIIALTGCIITIKHSKTANDRIKPESSAAQKQNDFHEIAIPEQTNLQERSLRNTFGWTRIDILTMLIVCIFLTSLCFSLLVEAVQTLIHIDHQDTMHYPLYVLVTGGFGFVLNGLCYVLIGGYTFHQGSFLHITSSGDVILDRVVSGEALRQGERRLSRTKKPKDQFYEPHRRQNLFECLRDICSTIFVVICSVIVYFANNEEISKFVDPLISIMSCIILLALSYPYLKESCLILLQTIPATIDIDLFKQNLLQSFSEIDSVHDLHIWQLTRNKYVSTVHIIFQNPSVYTRIMEDVIAFFHEQGITIVTIQPEFKCSNMKAMDCMVKCVENSCLPKHCCNGDIKENIEVSHSGLSRRSVAKSKSLQEIPSMISGTTLDIQRRGSSFAGTPNDINTNDNLTTESPLAIIQTSNPRRPLSSSDSNLPECETRLVSELPEDFETELNIETFNIDQVGKNSQDYDKQNICVHNSNDSVNIKNRDVNDVQNL